MTSDLRSNNFDDNETFLDEHDRYLHSQPMYIRIILKIIGIISNPAVFAILFIFGLISLLFISNGWALFGILASLVFLAFFASRVENEMKRYMMISKTPNLEYNSLMTGKISKYPRYCVEDGFKFFGDGEYCEDCAQKFM